MGLVRPLFLSGSYELTIDEKNRMLVPSEVRRQLVPERDGEGFYVVHGIDDHLWFYPELQYENLASRDPTQLKPSFGRLDDDRASYGLATRILWDKQGRILINERTVKRASLGKEVMLVGVKDHLELWPRDAWEARREELEKRAADVYARAKQVRLGSSALPTAL